MKSKLTTTLARTGIMLALVTLFQFLGNYLGVLLAFGPAKTILVGSLVNFVLVITTVFVGLVGAIVVGCLTPVMAALIGQLPLPVLIPFTAIGNVIFVLIIYFGIKLLDRTKLNNIVKLIISVVVASVIKYLYMFLLFKPIAIFFGAAGGNVLTLIYGVYQLIAALTGGAIATIVFATIGKYISNIMVVKPQLVVASPSNVKSNETNEADVKADETNATEEIKK